MKQTALALALAFCAHAHAMDARLKTVTYDPESVVLVNAAVGVAIHIVLSKGETYETHQFGDQNAWTFSNTGNHYFIKPKAENADTNLVIVTNKREYNLALHLLKSGNGSPWAVKNAIMQLRYKYPGETEASHSLADRFKAGTGITNLNYTESATVADQDITPLNVWDDGRFTYFRFPDNCDLPNVYVVGADGEETLVNRQMSPESSRVIVAQKIAAKFRLRLGDAVVGIYNESYTREGLPNESRTSTQSVHRFVKGDTQ